MYYQESSDIEADGLQTLYLMNPNFMGYTDTQQHQHQHQHQQSNMLFLNSNALNTATVPHAPPQHFVGVPLPASSLHNPNHHGLLQRMWSSVADQSQPHVPPPSTVVLGNPGGGTGGATTDLASQLGFQRPVAISPTQQQQQQQQGCLSLSLSPHRQISFRSVIPLNVEQHRDIRGSGASSSSVNNGISGMILGSKYLKVAQELLDEVVHVGKGIKEDDFDGDKDKKSEILNKESIPLASSDIKKPTSGVSDLTIAQRQELQMKKAKLVSMLEEVEQRYRQYHHQMQIIVTSFEQTAGSRSAIPYTQMALHAISKQFRCLKDAIFGQIKSTSKNLGEEGAEEGLGVKNIEGSGLKFVDHHRRQQRALQQLGMTQTNAWRPQRGLPERAVSVLRGWLFEHFLHPYPKDSDKIMLAKQTGLTRSQVSNWFINARVRLWKPMVEDMYLEEVKNQEPNTTSEDHKNHEQNKELDTKSSTKHNILDKQEHSTSPTTLISTSTVSTSPTTTTNGFSFMEHTADDHQRNMKKPRNDTEIMKARGTSYKGFNDKFDNDERQTRESSYNPLMSAYNIGDQFGRFNEEQLTTSTTLHHGNGVSLTLGLPPNSDKNQQNFISNHNVELESTSHYNRMRNPQASSHPNITYETIDFQSGKRYAAQLLQDFVA